MAAFHEAIKQILSDVDKFLSSALKDENLSKPAQKARTKILESIQKLYEEYEVLNPAIEEGSSNSSKGLSDDSRFTTGSAYSHGSEEDGSSDNIPYTTVKALLEPAKIGWLQKKPTDLLEKFSKQKKYCVVHKNIMYWFKKPSDKKHQGAIFLTGYEIKDLTQNDKEFLFELTASKKKSYQFQADNQADLTDWMKAVETGIKLVEPTVTIMEDDMEAADSGEEYEPIDDVVNAVRSRQAAEAHQAAMSSDTGSNSKAPNLPFKLPPIPTASTAPTTLPRQQQQQLPEPPSPQEIYDEGFSMPSQTTSNNNKMEEKKQPVANTNSNPNPFFIHEDSEEEEDDNLIYEYVEPPPPTSPTSSRGSDLNQTLSASTPPSRPPPALPPTPASDEPPPLPTRGPNIPAPPPSSSTETVTAATPPSKSVSAISAMTPPGPKKMCPGLDATIVSLLDEDYENLYYGLFASGGGGDDSKNELSFDRGDIIHVLSRDFDGDDWWVGESGGHIGLVPKDFITPAYQMVA